MYLGQPTQPLLDNYMELAITLYINLYTAMVHDHAALTLVVKYISHVAIPWPMHGFDEWEIPKFVINY